MQNHQITFLQKQISAGLSYVSLVVCLIFGFVVCLFAGSQLLDRQISVTVWVCVRTAEVTQTHCRGIRLSASPLMVWTGQYSSTNKIFIHLSRCSVYTLLFICLGSVSIFSCFWKSLFCSPRLHLLDQKYSKNSNYNLKYFFVFEYIFFLKSCDGKTEFSAAITPDFISV